MSTTPSRHHTLLIAELRAAGCVFAEEEARLLYESAGNAAELTVMLNQRCQGTPLEHVIGSVRFAGSRVHVDSGVFVPRARSEALVRRVVDRKSTRLNSSHVSISYAVFCLKKKIT